MARVAVKAHHYASMNPLAQFQKEITLEKALASQVISWPLKLYDACPITDGSAAVVLASEEAARRLTDTPVWIKGMGFSSDSANLSKRADYVGLRATVDASRKAYSAAKVGPKRRGRRHLPRLLHHRRADGLRGPRVLRQGGRGQAHPRGADGGRGKDPRQRRRRPQGKGPPDRGDGRLDDGRGLEAAQGRGRGSRQAR